MSTTLDPTDAATNGPAPTTPRMSRRETLEALSGLMMGIFVAILASTVVATALPRIITELGASQSSYTWIVTAELLAMTVTVPLWGKLADLFNQKLLVQLSLAFFVVGSIVAGLAPNIEVLIASRVVQGIGAGGLTALVQIVMAAMIPPRELGRYAGIFGAVFASATVGGPLIGGLLVDTTWLGWRWCFLVGVPFSLLAIALLQRTLRLPSVRRAETKIDYVGATLITTGVSMLLVWVTLAGSRFDWVSWWSLGLVGGGLALLALAVRVESRHPEPIIPLDLFRNRTVTLATLASVLVGVAMFGGTVFLAQFFQVSRGMSPTEAGLMSLPMVLGMLVSSTVAGGLVTRTGRWKAFVVTGAALMTVALGVLATIDEGTSLWLLGSYMALLGVGVGMLMQNLVLAAQNDVPAHELGSATSFVSFFRSMGGAVGTSVLGAVLANKVTAEVTASLGTAGSSGGTGGGHGAVPDLSLLPEPVRLVFEQAYASAIAEVFLVVTPVAALAVVAVCFLREKALKTTSGLERLAAESTGDTVVDAR